MAHGRENNMSEDPGAGLANVINRTDDQRVHACVRAFSSTDKSTFI